MSDRVQSQYAAGECSSEYYKQAIARITAIFQSLSQEVIHLIGVFREGGFSEVTKQLEDIQIQEKEKLGLTVKYQIMVQESSVGVKNQLSGEEDRTSECDEDEEKSQVQKRYLLHNNGTYR